jgi:hypothetical protein
MLEENDKLSDDWLKARDPDKSYFVLVIDELFKREDQRHNRLFGWLMEAYTNPASSLLKEHLAHRDNDQIEAVAKRIGCVTWQEINELLSCACPWFSP